MRIFIIVSSRTTKPSEVWRCVFNAGCEVIKRFEYSLALLALAGGVFLW